MGDNKEILVLNRHGRTSSRPIFLFSPLLYSSSLTITSQGNQMFPPSGWLGLLCTHPPTQARPA